MTDNGGWATSSISNLTSTNQEALTNARVWGTVDVRQPYQSTGLDIDPKNWLPSTVEERNLFLSFGILRNEAIKLLPLYLKEDQARKEMEILLGKSLGNKDAPQRRSRVKIQEVKGKMEILLERANTLKPGLGSTLLLAVGGLPLEMEDLIIPKIHTTSSPHVHRLAVEMDVMSQFPVQNTQSQDEAGRELFVKNFSTSTTEADLLNYISQRFQGLIHCRLKQKDGKSFAFLEFDTPQNAQTVLDTHQHQPIHINNRRLDMDLSRGRGRGARGGRTDRGRGRGETSRSLNIDETWGSSSRDIHDSNYTTSTSGLAPSSHPELERQRKRERGNGNPWSNFDSADGWKSTESQHLNGETQGQHTFHSIEETNKNFDDGGWGNSGANNIADNSSPSFDGGWGDPPSGMDAVNSIVDPTVDPTTNSLDGGWGESSITEVGAHNDENPADHGW